MRLALKIERAAWRVLAPADALMNRVYTWRYNPLYHSGAIVVLLLIVVLVTGVYLLFFYRISTPYASVLALTEQRWAGGWIRALHRYASDAIIVATLVHAFRVFAQGRTWGPRALAWITGLGLLFLILVCGWTGYVMVWDTQGLVLAREGARFLDALPVFAEPIGRAFVGDGPIPRAFFFMNLFLHVALPIGLAVALWVHSSRSARPSVLPPRTLGWAIVVVLTVAAIVWPVGIGPMADVFQLSGAAPYDWFYAFFLPLTQPAPAGPVWLVTITVAGVLFAVPWIMRNRGEAMQPSFVNERTCDGCRTCYLDCPYEAISMVDREVERDAPGRSAFVARVDPALCVSCGICAGSCAPMGVGPPPRTGRDQLQRVREFIAREARDLHDVVIVGCSRGSGGITDAAEFDGAQVFDIDCAGSLHTSVVEFLVRSGVGGVMIVSCPPRDCWNREGPHWLEQRLYHNREAELQARVDRRRVRLVYAAYGERRTVRAELARFKEDIAAIDGPVREENVEIDTSCVVAEEGGT